MARIVAENLDTHDCEVASDLPSMFEGVYWCSHCQIPLLLRECPLCHRRAGRCASDLKPVFGEERRLFEAVAGVRLPAFLFANRNRVYFGGKTLFTFTVDSHDGLRLLTSDMQQTNSCDPCVYSEDYAQEQWKMCLLANQMTLQTLEEEAIDFIRRQAERFSDRAKVISFSGGKDSAVTATLVRRALGSVPLLFADTTMEFPDTYAYVQRFAESNGFELFREEPQADFLSLCEILGPPSRIMRWCCTVCKSRPINEFYSRLSCNALSFDGVRRMESSRRADYPRVVHVQKLARQVAARPIANWSSFGVWLYTFAQQLEHNSLYEFGYSRVGCVYCPGNTPFSEYLTQLNFPDLRDKWIEYLIRDAVKSGKKDPETYVLGGYWKSRNITKRRAIVVEPSGPCGPINGTVYSFKRPISPELPEFLKPFGQLSFLKGTSETGFFVGSENPLLISGILGDSQLSVTLGKKQSHLLRMQVEKQIEKYLNCVHCGACAGVCLEGAISIQGGMYHIDESKCTRCRRCVTTKYLKEGCVALNFGPLKLAVRR